MKTLKKVLGDASVTNDTKKFVDKHIIATTPDANGNGDDVFKGTNIKPIEREKNRQGYDAEKDEEVYEEAMSDSEKDDREKYVKGMKKNLSSFLKLYGPDANSVMYATATKMAKEEVEESMEQLEEDELTQDLEAGIAEDIAELYELLDESQQSHLVELLDEEKYDELFDYIEQLGDE